MSWKRSVLVRSEMLGLVVSNLIVDDMYFRHNRENLAQPIKKQLSKKTKTFLLFFIAFLKPTSNSEDFEKR